MLIPTKQMYVIDFFNVFSDYRETYYKNLGMNFHNVKYTNLLEDTVNFFNLFFDDYLPIVNINRDSEFIFVMKKIHNYEGLLESIINTYKEINIKFVIITDKYQNVLVEQNKDDFICQYLLSIYPNSILISNDKYRNRIDYLELYRVLNKINIQVIHNNRVSERITNANTFYIINKNAIDKIHRIKFNRASLPKSKFNTLYNNYRNVI